MRAYFSVLSLGLTAFAGNALAQTGKSNLSPVGEVGKRQSREETTQSVKPMTRIDNRLETRIDTRLRNRFEDASTFPNDTNTLPNDALAAFKRRSPN